MTFKKPSLSFWQIWNMNIGFLGIQFSFGLQQTAINPIFSFLGAEPHDLPLLNIAGPVTGLIIQPLIGAISDKTWSPKFGRRKPFFLIGAIIGSLCLFAFPFSPTLWFAVGLLWLLDVGNNTAMEPYRAFIGDKLPEKQLGLGFQMQSLFVGAGIVLANASIFLFQDWFGGGTVEGTNTIPTWLYYSFFIGAVLSVATILWTVLKTPEIPPTEEELIELETFNKNKPHPLSQILFAILVIVIVPLVVWLLLINFTPILLNEYFLLGIFIIVLAVVIWLGALYKVIKNNENNKRIKFLGNLLSPFIETIDIINVMPKFMWKLAWVYLFQWYALFCYWQFISPMFEVTMNFGKSDALAQASKMNLTYNLITMAVALALVPLAAKLGNKKIYVASLFGTGIAMLCIPYITDSYLVLVPMVLFGIGWAAMMGIPYTMVSKVIPQDKRGIYMGIVNVMIVIPMFIQTLTFGPIMKNLLNNNAVNAILFGGVFFIIAAFLATRLNLSSEEV